MTKEEAERFRQEMQEKMMKMSKTEIADRMKKMQEMMSGNFRPLTCGCTGCRP